MAHQDVNCLGHGQRAGLSPFQRNVPQRPHVKSKHITVVRYNRVKLFTLNDQFVRLIRVFDNNRVRYKRVSLYMVWNKNENKSV